MSWILIGQAFDVVLSGILVVHLVRLGLHWKYLALLIFVLCDGLQSLIYVPFRMTQPFDYRYFYLGNLLLTWCTTIWVVYALMTSILKQFPGIKRFCLFFLNLVFIGWIVISLLSIRPEWAASHRRYVGYFLAQLIAFSAILDRAFSVAEILVILSILAFVLKFPMKVARNLAAFSAGLAVYLFSHVSFFLLVKYVPYFQKNPVLNGIPSLITAACLGYWLYKIDSTGEEALVTLGRGWQSVPKETIFTQLEAMNAALLRSREQA